MTLETLKPEFVNEDCEELSSELLLNTDSPIPDIEFLLDKNMDFSVDSLEYLDEYLGRQNINQMTISESINLTHRCGSYLGEVIRKNSEIDYNWLGYAGAVAVNEKIKTIEFGMESTYMLYSDDGGFVFPLAKVVKRIEYGEEENIVFFAKIAISGSHRRKN